MKVRVHLGPNYSRTGRKGEVKGGIITHVLFF